MSNPPQESQAAATASGITDPPPTAVRQASFNSASSTRTEEEYRRLIARLLEPSLEPAVAESTNQRSVGGDETTTPISTLGKSEPDVHWARVLSRHAPHNDKWKELRDWFTNQDVDDNDRLQTVKVIFGLSLTNLELSELVDISTEEEYDHERLQLISAFVAFLNLPIQKISLDGDSEGEGVPLVDWVEPREVLEPFVRAVYTISRATTQEIDKVKQESLREMIIRQGEEWVDDWPTVRYGGPRLNNDMLSALPTDVVESLQASLHRRRGSPS